MTYWKNVGDIIVINGIEFKIISIINKTNNKGDAVPYYVLQDEMNKTPNDNFVGEYEDELRKWCG